MFFITFYGLNILPFAMPSGSRYTYWANVNTLYLDRWANWDGGHYLGIIINGYLPIQVVFFPLYPLLAKILTFLGVQAFWATMFISHAAALGALFFLFKLVLQETGSKTLAQKSIFYLLAFPTSFYLGAVYTESLFLFLTLAAFYFAINKKWILAFLFASLTALTRTVGVFVILAIAAEYYIGLNRGISIKQLLNNTYCRIAGYFIILKLLGEFIKLQLLKNNPTIFLGILSQVLLILDTIVLGLVFLLIIYGVIKTIDITKILSKVTIYLILSTFPFLTYLFTLYLWRGNPFAFIEQQSSWQRKVTYIWEAPFNYFHILNSYNFFTTGFTGQLLLEFIFFVFLFVFFLYSVFKLRLSYSIFFAAALFIPIATGTLSAIHRYGLVIFPIYLILVQIKNETFRQIWLIFSITMLGILSVLFINGYWVT